ATGIFLVVGVIEQSSVEEGKGNGGTLYCTIIFIDSKRGYVGKHRKLMPTGAEKLIWGQGDQTSLPVIQAGFKPIRKEKEEGADVAGGDAVVNLRLTAAI